MQTLINYFALLITGLALQAQHEPAVVTTEVESFIQTVTAQCNTKSWCEFSNDTTSSNL